MHEFAGHFYFKTVYSFSLKTKTLSNPAQLSLMGLYRYVVVTVYEN